MTKPEIAEDFWCEDCASNNSVGLQMGDPNREVILWCSCGVVSVSARGMPQKKVYSFKEDDPHEFYMKVSRKF